MVELDKLYRIALENAAIAQGYRKRFAYERIEKTVERMAGGTGKKAALLISGMRGVGKTTLMLQLFGARQNAFYFSADSILAKTSSLYALVEEAYRNGYRMICIDEIHKYPRWIEEIKNVYDDFDAQIIASGSSTAAIKKGSIVLGRRALDFVLSPLTFGEFVYLREGQRYVASLPEALEKKDAIRWLAVHPTVEKHYKEYTQTGGFPLPKVEKDEIFKLIKKMIYEDALAEFSLTENKVDIADKLLGFLSLAKPGEFSYTSFSSISGYAKSTVYEAVYMLQELGILRVLEEESPKSKVKGTVKLLFAHPNLRAAFAGQLMKEAEIGALREEYFLFHMHELGLPVFLPKKGKKTPDYEVRIHGKKTLLEIGGESKTPAQFMGMGGRTLGDNQLMVLGCVHNVQRTDQK